MPRSQSVQRIERPADVVFDFLADGANNPQWQPLVIQTRREGGSLGVGTRYTQQMRHPLGFRVSSDYTLTRYDRPKTLSFEVTSGGPVRPTGTFELTPIDAGTTDVRYTIEYRTHGLMSLLVPFLAVAGLLFRWQTSSLRGAKRIVEAP
jgi:uncharacterized protein YndB with AHSA1/START domain